MGLFVSVIQVRFMSSISEKPYTPLLFMLIIGAGVVLSACQPVSQTTERRLVTVPVIFPNQTTDAPAESATPAVNADTQTALQDDELAAEPSAGDDILTPQAEPDMNEASIVVRRAGEPATPVVAARFNPADLVGRPKSFLDAQFGQADFSRTDGILYVLQYRQPDCVIDLFITLSDSTQTTPAAGAEITDWAMRERIVNQPLDLALCEQQFFERKR